MSQAGTFGRGGGGVGEIVTITGNVGGPVPPDGAGNINLVGSTGLTVVGDALTNTLTIELTGSVATVYDADVGSATPSLGILNISGLNGITTTGSGNTIVVETDGSVALTYDGNTGSAIPALGILNIVGSGSVSTNAAGNTVTISLSGGTGVTSITGDTGGPITGALTITGGTSGASFDTTGTTITESFNFLALPDTNNPLTQGYISFGTDPAIAFYGGVASQNIFLGVLSGNAANTGTQNTALGYGTLDSLTNGTINVAIGNLAMPNLTTGSANVAVGQAALNALVDASSNVAVGQGALASLTTGSGANVAVGPGALSNIGSGFLNTAIGNNAGSALTANDSLNLLLANNGVTGDSGTIRIGNGAFHNLCYVAGVYGSAVGGTNAPVFIDNNGLLGTSGGSGGGVTFITGDTGGAITGSLTITGFTSGASFDTTGTTITESFNFLNMADTNAGGTTGYLALAGTPILAAYGGVGNSNIFLGSGSGIASITGVGNTFVGALSGTSMTSGNLNTGIGVNALAAVTSGLSNVALGDSAGTAITTGQNNVAVGTNSLEHLTTSNNNTALGRDSLASLTTGSTNTALGYQAGNSYTGSESSNIVIRNTGTAAESNVIRIGTQGSGAGQQNTCFIAGIAGVTVANSAAVLIDTTTGQLGTVISSERYKENIHDMGSDSHKILTLRPVSFSYKSDPKKQKRHGLIAEEVEKIMPNLVSYNKEGLPETVQYHELCTFLLNEIQYLTNRVKALEEQFSARVR
jgi:trimeric autotransporter adhesin